MKNIQSYSDEQLVEMVCTQDVNLYAELITRYQKKLVRYATFLIGDPHLATDAVQEAFIKAYINLRGFNTQKKFSSWMYRIVHNQALTVATKNKQHFSTDVILDYDSGVNLEDEFIKEELKKHLHHCINQIPIIYKAPLTLYFLEEKKYEEISDILRIPMGTVATRINRAKAVVKKICQKKL